VFSVPTKNKFTRYLRWFLTLKAPKWFAKTLVFYDVFAAPKKANVAKNHRYPQSQQKKEHQLRSDFLQLKFGSERTLLTAKELPPFLVATGGKVLEFFWDVSQLF